MRSETIEEAKEIIQDQAIVIDLLNEEIAELRERAKVLEVQYHLILRDYKTAEILPFR